MRALSQIASVPEAHTYSAFLFGIGYVRTFTASAIHDDDVIGMCGRLTFDPIYTWRQIRISRYSDYLAANLSTWTLICFQHLRSMVEWQKGLEKKGLYYEGIIDGSRLDSVLEHHRRATVSTFATRRSSRVAAPTDKLTNNENVCV